MVTSNLECECLHCGVKRRGYANRCEACGAWNTIRQVARPVAANGANQGALPFYRPGSSAATLGAFEAEQAQKALGIRAVPLAEVGDAPIEQVRSWEPFDEVMAGGFARGTTCLLDGAKGKGKSTVATHVALCWPGKSVYLTAEAGQGPGFVAARIHRLAPATNADLSILKIDRIDLDRWDAVAAILAQYSLVIVDSVQGFTPNYREQLELTRLVGECMGKTRGCGLLLSRVNGRGQAAGWEELPHQVDACLSLVETEGGHAELVATKNRNGPLSSVLLGMREEGMFLIRPSTETSPTAQTGAEDLSSRARGTD